MAAENLATKSFTHLPLLAAAVCFAAGIAAAAYLPVGVTPMFAMLALAILCAIVLREKASATVAVLTAFMLAGALSLYAETAAGRSASRLKNLYDSGQILSGDPLEVEGVVRSAIEPAYDGYFFELAADRVAAGGELFAATGTIRFFVPTDAADAGSDAAGSQISYGSRIRVAARPLREEQFQNPGVRSRKATLDEQGIDATAVIKRALLMEPLGRESSWTPRGALFAWRQTLIYKFREHLDGPTSGIIIASLLGDKYFIDKDTAEVFREGGIFHILVISGLHITFLGGLALMASIRVTRRRWLQFILASGFLWAYTIAVGADIPVVRACVVFTILLFSRIVYRDTSLLNSLGACAMLLLAYRPSSLFTASFQLTFISVAALVGIAFPLVAKLRAIGTWMPSALHPFPPAVPVFLRRCAETLYWRDLFWNHEARRHIWSANLFKSPFVRSEGRPWMQAAFAYLFEGVLVSFVVQAALLPLSVYQFHRISFAGIFLNLWVGILLAAETFAAVTAVVVSAISETLATPLFRATEILNALLLYFPQMLSGSAWSGMRIPAYTGPASIVYFVYSVPVIALGAMLYRWKVFSRARVGWLFDRRLTISAATAASVLAGAIAFHPFDEPAADGSLRVEFLDVGQGDSALVTFPNGETMLVDAGGRLNFTRPTTNSDTAFEPDGLDIGEAVVSRFLWNKGYDSIDFVVATHSDADHIGGLGSIAKNFRIGELWAGESSGRDQQFTQFSEALTRKGAAALVVRQGETRVIGGVTVDILWPPSDALQAIRSDNDNSVVIKLTYGARSILVTGDVERGTERALAAANTALDADVVKVPHHGSRTSSTAEFVNAVRPQYAVISVGRRSPFGHPNADVVDRWRNAGANVITTGESGTVSVVTDGTDLIIETFR